MNRFFLPPILGCFGALTVFSAQARLFEPQAVPPKLEADDQTVALYEFRQADFEQKKVPDVTGKKGAGEVAGSWTYLAMEELLPLYQGVGKILPTVTKTPAQVEFPGITELKQGAFSVDIYMRWDSRGAGNFLKAGGATLGIQHGGPGELQLRVPVAGDGSKVDMAVFTANDFYKTAPVPRQSDFHVYSLTYDGERTFRVLMDGTEIYTVTVPEGKKVMMSDAFGLGDVQTYKRPVQGLEIAAARVSKGVRQYAAAANDATFPKGKKASMVFDAGTAESPVEAGAIKLTPADTYTAQRGYGWLGQVAGGYDEPLMPDRYANNPDIAVKNNSYRFVDEVNRDGVVLEPGQFFRMDVPDGQYWVAVEFGHNRDTSILDTVTANGTVIGQKLATSSSTYLSQPPMRVARGVVTVSGGNGITIEAAVSDKSKVPVREIVVIPYEPLPIICEKGELIWKGIGTAPAQLGAISTALKAGDFVAAVAEAKKIADPFLQANALECVLGVPHLPSRTDQATAGDVRQLLLKVLREQPGNVQARWLFDSAERYRYTVTGYLQDATDVISGTRFDLWARVPNYGLSLRDEDPGHWQARFLAGGGLWQQGIQSSAFDMNGTSDAYLEKKSARLKGYDAPGGIFREIIAAYPDFRLAKVMLGEKLTDESSTWQPPENAPEWASLEYQLLQRILSVIHYWVNERMDDKGFLGGGIGDDVEVMRWWTPGVVVADDETTIAGWNRMATGVWNSTGKVGYSAGMDDVEHSSEPTSDPLPMLYLMNYGTPKAEEARKMITATLPIFRDIWTETTPEGLRYFKGYHFNSKAIERPGDVPYNIRAIKPLLWAAWSDPQNTEIRDLMVAYAKNWREGIMSEGNGKPRGIVPMMIKPDRTFHEPEAKSWVSPGYAAYEYPAGNAGKVYDLMLAGWEMSGDPSFLEPVKFALDALRRVPADDRDPAKYPVGSFDWAIRAGFSNIVVAGTNYRMLTGDKSYDDVLLELGPPHIRFLIAAEKAGGGALSEAALKPLIASLKKDLTTMNTNPELRTTLIQSTDRIYVSGSLIVSAMATGVATTAAGYTKPDEDLRGGEIVWPTFQITWRGTGGQVTPLVTSAGPEKLEVLLYNFADQAKTLKPQVWRLKAGNYNMVLTETDKSGAPVKELSRKDQAVSGPGQEVEFEIPSHTNVKLSFVKK